MKKQLVAFAIVGLVSGFASAGEWQFAPGLTYASGISDVIDQIEANETIDGDTNPDITNVPVGIGFFSHYQFDSGMRLGFGLAPLFVVSEDVSYTEIPLYATVGYTFFPASNVSPYIFGGYAAHYVDGDYVSDDGQFSGAVYGVGIEFARNKRLSYVLEIARDTTEVDFELWLHDGYYFDSQGNVIFGQSFAEYKSIKSYDTTISFRLMF